MFKLLKIALTLLLFNGICYSQVYEELGKNRYTFAQSMVGYDLEFSPTSGKSYQRNKDGNLEQIDISGNIVPAISITGLHFWGYAEFFTSFSIASFSFRGNDNSFNRFGSTGFKFFILPVRKQRLSPFVGMAVSSFSFQQGNGVTQKKADYPILTGLTYSFEHGILEAGLNLHPNTKHAYYISKSEQITYTQPLYSIYMDYKYFFDFSLTSMKKEQNGKLEKDIEFLRKEKKLNTFYFSIGPSYSFFTGSSSYNQTVLPFLGDHRVTGFFADVGLGYYNYKYDFAINFSFRSNESELSAYGVTQVLQRKSFALEAFKFLADYHGFVPFIGGIGSYENLNIQQSGIPNETPGISIQKPSYGVIAGWDIRPTRSDWWGIRTNIRYYPSLRIDMRDNFKLDAQQLELNFLQLVIYPERLYAYAQRKEN